MQKKSDLKNIVIAKLLFANACFFFVGKNREELFFFVVLFLRGKVRDEEVTVLSF